MKHIRLFEELNIPKIGDYVLVDIEYDNSMELQNFINNNIGKVIDVYNEKIKEVLAVQYINIPENIRYSFSTRDSRRFNIHNIISFGTKEQMELELQAKKYNL